MLRSLTLSFIALLSVIVSGTAHAERVKDLVSVSGLRGNQLVGYGLVVGLNKTGETSYSESTNSGGGSMVLRHAA